MNRLARLVTTLGIVVITFALIFIFIVHPTAENQSPASNSKRSLLVQFRDAELFSELNFIVVDHGSKWFYLPNNLVFERSMGSSTLGATSQNLILQNSQNQLNDSVGIQIDDVWQINKVAFASLIEAVDGVTVQDLAAKTLTGFEAYSYVFDATDRPEEVLQRFEEIWPQVVDSFGSRNLQNELTAIGSSSRSSIEQSEFIGYLRMMNKHRKQLVFKKLQLTSDYTLKVKARQRLIDAGVRETLAP